MTGDPATYVVLLATSRPAAVSATTGLVHWAAHKLPYDQFPDLSVTLSRSFSNSRTLQTCTRAWGVISYLGRALSMARHGSHLSPFFDPFLMISNLSPTHATLTILCPGWRSKTQPVGGIHTRAVTAKTEEGIAMSTRGGVRRRDASGLSAAMSGQ